MALLALLALGLSGSAVHAQLTLTLSPDTQPGAPGGDPLTFSGVFANTGSETLFLTLGMSSLPGDFLTDDTPFAFNAPQSLDAGQSSDTIALFNVTVLPTALDGSYLGAFTVNYGTTAGAVDRMVETAFVVNIGASSPVPGPGALPLFAGGAASLGLILRRRR